MVARGFPKLIWSWNDFPPPPLACGLAMIFWFRWTQWQHGQWIILCRLGTQAMQTPIIVFVSVGPRLETGEVGKTVATILVISKRNLEVPLSRCL